VNSYKELPGALTGKLLLLVLVKLYLKALIMPLKQKRDSRKALRPTRQGIQKHLQRKLQLQRLKRKIKAFNKKEILKILMVLNLMLKFKLIMKMNNNSNNSNSK
jgi:hypothetical protein